MDFYTLLTNNGKGSITRSYAMSTPLHLTTFAVGDGGDGYYDPDVNQDNLINETYRGNISKIYVDSEYENRLISNNDLEKITEENDQNDIIKSTLKELKSQEYQVFIMFYSEGKTVKEIAKILNFSESKVKVVLHRVRKKIKTNLEDGGYSYGK